MSEFHVYVLKSTKTNRRYVGSCGDLKKRLLQHNSAQILSTKHGVPWELIYFEILPTRTEAIRKERYFKTGKGREFLDKVARTDPDR